MACQYFIGLQQPNICHLTETSSVLYWNSIDATKLPYLGNEDFDHGSKISTTKVSKKNPTQLTACQKILEVIYIKQYIAPLEEIVGDIGNNLVSQIVDRYEKKKRG